MRSHPLNHYLLIVALAAVATGIQLVMIPWLASAHLHLPAAQVGWVQACLLFPSALLLLAGGSFADRPLASRWLAGLYWVPAGIHILMAAMMLHGTVSFWILALYAAGLGMSFAMVQPLRDRLLPDVLADSRPGGLQRGVVLVSMFTYLGQGAGVWLAGRVDIWGAVSLLLCQSAVLLMVSRLVKPLARGLPVDEARSDTQTLGIIDGLRYITGHAILRQLIALVAFNGFINLGGYLVALPLLVRDVYEEGAGFFSLLQLWFVAGTVVSTLVLLRRGRVKYMGRSLLFCLLYSAMIMLAIASGPMPRGLCLLLFAWGVVTGISSSMGKTLLQQSVSDQYRGRTLSIYFLALLGAAPLGALFCGYLMGIYGALEVFRLVGLVSGILFFLTLLSPVLWGAASEERSHPS